MCAQEANCVPRFNNFSETPCMKGGLDVRISLVRVLSTGVRGKRFPQMSHLPPQKKVFPENKLTLFWTGGQICPPAGFFNIAQKLLGLGS